MPRSASSVAVLLTLCAGLCVHAASQSIATNSTTPLSTRVVAYNLDAKIDTAKKALDATETLTYKNLTGQPLASFPFHLYLNGFQPDSTFTSETHFTGGIRDSESENTYPPEKMGSIVITHIDADGYGDLTSAMRFIAPDDHNANDRTVTEVVLPHPLAPGDSITFHLAFHDQFPVSIARNGYKRDFLMGGQWFPKVGVFWHGAWNCHQYHATTEFFSDFGTYTVHLTLPRRYVVGATGVPTGEVDNPATQGQEASKTLSFYGEDIGDFAFAASPHFETTDSTFLSSLGPVRIHVLSLAAHPNAGRRYTTIMQQTLAQFDRRYGPYPYKILTVIDPEPGSEIGGMEYPTLFTGDTNWYEPSHITEVTAEHEFGHQYWYGMVATNEFEDAWLDEGINSYTEVKVLASILGPNTSMFDRSYANAGDASLQRLQYVTAADLDPVTRHAWQFRNSLSYAGITYSKTAMLLATLEGIIGTETMDDAMRTYFMRYRFTHPTTEDFLRTLEEVAVRHGKAVALTTATTQANQYHLIPDADSTLPARSGIVPPARNFLAADLAINAFNTPVPFSTDYAAAPPVNSTLRPFLNQAVYGTQVLDYRVDAIASDPVQWWLPIRDEKTTDFLTTVYLRRSGDFILPVTVEVVFSDGTRLRETWDGVDRWKKFTYVRRAKIVSAEIDPDHVVPLDKDLFNNSITRAQDTIPRRKLTTLWLAAQQVAEQLITWLV